MRVHVTLIDPVPFGPVAVVWREREGSPAIVRVLLSRPGRSAASRVSDSFPGAAAASCAAIDGIAARIRVFLGGGDVSLPLDLCDWAGCSPFQRSVLRAESEIPRGSVSTYGLIAARLNRPGGARAVGGALAGNPFPLLVPCHRAIRSDGHLGGFQGGLAMKRALLSLEGVEADERGRVIRPRLHYG